ncbi:MAG: DotU family type IV/VI secretion system protein, partial [Proteobacteria bacterium]|nr:DotU family type IV/VI secretion system protein [Pseudomonadota bacterium]
ASSIQRKLRLILEEQAMRSLKQVGDFAANHYKEAQYIMVALADEIFINLDWFGKEQWENTLLETQLYHTQIAGEQVFKRLESLLEANDPVRSDVAIIYLMTLGLGFRGKYRGLDDQQKISWYRHQLFQMIERRPSNLFNPGRPYLIKTCYDYTLKEPVGRGLPNIRKWIYVFASVLGLYCFISYIAWYKLIREMGEVVQYILDQTRYISPS